MDVRTSRVDSFFFSGSSEVSRYSGSSDESPGDWHSYPSRTQEAKKSPLEKVPRFRTRRLAFDGRDAPLLPTPIYMIPSAGRFREPFVKT